MLRCTTRFTNQKPDDVSDDDDVTQYFNDLHDRPLGLRFGQCSFCFTEYMIAWDREVCSEAKAGVVITVWHDLGRGGTTAVGHPAENVEWNALVGDEDHVHHCDMRRFDVGSLIRGF
jgi:hypothetical protein